MYNQSNEQVKNILDVWKITELLTPSQNLTLNKYFELAKKLASDREEFFHKIDKDILFLLQDAPFETFHIKDLEEQNPKHNVFVHWHLYLGYLNWTEAELAIEEKLNQLFKDENWLKNRSRSSQNPKITPIAGLILDNEMNLINGSVVLSTGAYAFGKIMQDEFSYKDFQDLVKFEDNRDKLGGVLRNV